MFNCSVLGWVSQLPSPQDLERGTYSDGAQGTSKTAFARAVIESKRAAYSVRHAAHKRAQLCFLTRGVHAVCRLSEWGVRFHGIALQVQVKDSQ